MMAALRREVADFPITLILCASYIGLFIAMVVSQGALVHGASLLALGSLNLSTLVDFGAIDGHKIFNDHEYWRLLTATVLHGSIPHVVLNVLALYQLGRIVEDWYGGSVLVFLHGALGLAGSLVSLWFHRLMPRIVQCGGSGAIFGLAAFIAIAAFFDPDKRMRELFRSLVVSMIAGLVIGYYLGADNFAHAGGTIAGACLGTVDFLFRREARFRRWIVGLGLCTVAVYGGAFWLCFQELSVVQEQRAEEQQRRDQLELRQKQDLLLIHAQRDLLTIFEHANRAFRQEKPEPLDRRLKLADSLEAIAGHVEDQQSAEFMGQVVGLLRTPTDAAYITREHLEKVLALFEYNSTQAQRRRLERAKDLKPAEIPLIVPKRWPPPRINP